MYSDSVSLRNLLIDNNIIYRDFANTASPYSYVNKIIELNRTRLCAAFQLTSITIDYDTYALKLIGSSMVLVQQALVCISNMLQGPVYSLRIDPDLVMAMRVLKYVKTDFSSKTGCWLHFIWASETVTCYGLDGKAAEEYLLTTLNVLKNCKNPGYASADGRILVERLYSRHVKKFIKKNVDDIESRTGALVAVKSSTSSSMGTIVVQFYGIAEGVEEACKMIEREVGFGAIPGSADFTTLSPETLKCFPRSASTSDGLSLQFGQLSFPQSSSMPLSEGGSHIVVPTTMSSFPPSFSTSSLMSHSPYLSRTTVDACSGELVTIAGGLQPENASMVTTSVTAITCASSSFSQVMFPTSNSNHQMSTSLAAAGAKPAVPATCYEGNGSLPLPTHIPSKTVASSNPCFPQPPLTSQFPLPPPSTSSLSSRNAVFRAALETDVPFNQLIKFLKAIDQIGITIQEAVGLLSLSTATYQE